MLRAPCSILLVSSRHSHRASVFVSRRFAFPSQLDKHQQSGPNVATLDVPHQVLQLQVDASCPLPSLSTEASSTALRPTSIAGDQTGLYVATGAFADNVWKTLVNASALGIELWGDVRCVPGLSDALQCWGLKTNGLYATFHICEVFDAREECLSVVRKDEEKSLELLFSTLTEESVQINELLSRTRGVQTEVEDPFDACR